MIHFETKTETVVKFSLVLFLTKNVSILSLLRIVSLRKGIDESRWGPMTISGARETTSVYNSRILMKIYIFIPLLNISYPLRLRTDTFCGLK